MKKNITALAICIFISIATFNSVPANEVDVDAIKNPRATDSSAVSNGKKLFLKRCSICHGEKADGSGPSAESFEVPPWGFTDNALDDISDGYLFQKIKNGGVWFEMPPFGLILKDNEIWDLITFLRSI